MSLSDYQRIMRSAICTSVAVAPLFRGADGPNCLNRLKLIL